MNETEIVRLIEQVCKDYNRPIPREIRFTRRPDGFTLQGRGGAIGLPSNSLVSEYELFCADETCVGIDDSHNSSERGYRLLVLHELAHWITRSGNHSPEFYSRVFELCRRYGVNLDYALKDESSYSRRNAKRGWALFEKLHEV